MRKPDIRVCFVGDSYVHGVGDPECRGWVGRIVSTGIRRGFPITGYNLGVRQNSTRDIMKRWAQECSARLPEQSDCFVVLSFGVNDAHPANGISRQEALDNCHELLEAISKSYRTVLIGPPPVMDATHNDLIADLSVGFAAVAQRTKTPYLPVFAALTIDRIWRSEISHDGYHPSGGGYHQLAEFIDRWHEWPFREKREPVTGRRDHER
ncbi:MAG: GDSL-type esterase/lipase family protein [Acidiferrobacteraceae bacterium]